MVDMHLTKKKIKCSSFSSEEGVQESFLTGISSDGVPFAEALDELAAAYESALEENGLDSSTQQFVRIYVSDIYNEEPLLLGSKLYKLAAKSAFGVLEQSPLGDSAVGILAYHIKSDDGSFKQEVISFDDNYSNQSVFAKGKNYSLLWSSGYIGKKEDFDRDLCFVSRIL